MTIANTQNNNNNIDCNNIGIKNTKIAVSEVKPPEFHSVSPKENDAFIEDFLQLDQPLIDDISSKKREYSQICLDDENIDLFLKQFDEIMQGNNTFVHGTNKSSSENSFSSQSQDPLLFMSNNNESLAQTPLSSIFSNLDRKNVDIDAYKNLLKNYNRLRSKLVNQNKIIVTYDKLKESYLHIYNSFLIVIDALNINEKKRIQLQRENDELKDFVSSKSDCSYYLDNPGYKDYILEQKEKLKILRMKNNKNKISKIDNNRVSKRKRPASEKFSKSEHFETINLEKNGNHNENELLYQSLYDYCRSI
ncbi:uncharacterized protein ASCRUDRAFT_9225 [Ascoidea rubescens DSM 1968]|uniref:Uncharacterized protein n=1 Tax=Ascoidea rubescens DSM 1968 TaxID=1344418 RepID=A0A1D2VCX3_9ASCO|nr:hypothetical protein ASCRUDRAFT_9225 [Ascoidea rubescens DSM 1968]ODV59548.1 hypothetical protein ASCRUDRAFT_9225 [Ascoidea rubescens DSM 1968]